MSRHLQLFGVPTLSQDGEVLRFKPERRFCLLAVVAVAPTWVSRNRLAELFWPEREASVARRNLRKLLLEVRQMEIHGLQEGPAGLLWPIDTDLARFQRSIDDGDWHTASLLASEPLMRDIEAGHGSPAFAAWLAYERGEAYKQASGVCLHAAMRALGTGKDVDNIAAACARLLAVEPLDEDLLIGWIHLKRRAGHDEQVHVAYQAYARGLAEEMGIDPSDRVRAAVEPVQRPLMGAALTPLLGRGPEMADARSMLDDPAIRLITVIGPGGVGKTHLVRHLLDSVADRFPSSWFVPVEDLGTPAELPGHLADRVRPGLALGDDPVAALVRAWPVGPSLVVLDGFEHLVDAAGLLTGLLERLPALRIVVTSRERLDVSVEQLLPLADLGAPDAQASAEEVLAHPAVRLFVDRAKRVHPSFDGLKHWQALLAICVATEGLPLALELAAAWARLLPIDDIERDLRGTASLLDGETHARSMSASFAHSWALLTPSERDAFAKLAVFQGGFTREAAGQVADVALPVLASLVDKSMLRVDDQGRFDRHALLHARARDKLATQPALALHMDERHGRWCLTHLQRHFGLLGGGHAAKRAAIARERANILRAWQGWLDRRAATELEAAAEVLSWFHIVEGRLPDGIALFDRAARSLGAEASTAGALMLAHRSWFELWMEHHDLAQSLARRALQALDAAGHRQGATLARRTLAHAARLSGRHAESARLLTEALRSASREGDPRTMATLLDAAAMAWTNLGHYRRAETKLHQAMALNQLVGNEGQQMYNEFNLSRALAYDGDLEAAKAWAGAAARRAKDIGYRFFEPYALCQRAWVALQQGRLVEASADVALALALADGIGGRPASAWALELRARIMLAQGLSEAARDDVLQGAHLACEAGNVLMGAPLVVVAARVARARGSTGQAELWLGKLLASDQVQVPVRTEAASLREGRVPVTHRGEGVLALLRAASAGL